MSLFFCCCENNSQLFLSAIQNEPCSPCCLFLYLQTGQMTIGRASGEEGDPLLSSGKIHFVRRFGFKSVGTNLWHEVILCWSFIPKFIHQLFTVNADCISVGNYKGWVFSLRQKECDTAEPTPNLMCQRQCPSGVRERRIIYVLETVCLGERKKADTLFKPFITCINISAEINKGCWACLEDSCSLLRLACLERVGGLLGCQAYQPWVKPLHLFLIIHLEQGDCRSCQGELL